MIKLTIDDRQVRAALDRLMRAGDDMTPAMREIAGVLADAAERAFQAERDPVTGAPWKPLKKSTIRQRIKLGKWPGPILQRSAGGLAGSIQSEHGRHHAAAGTNKEYASTHQFGAKTGEFGTGTYKSRPGSFPIPWGNIPARPFLGIGPDDKDDILDIIRRHINSAIR